MCRRTASRPGPLGTALLLLLFASLAAPTSAAASPPEPLAPPGLAPAAATPNIVTNIAYNLPSPNILQLNENVNLTFDYQTDEPGGVIILGQPFSGALIPTSVVTLSPVYPTGSGSGSWSFAVIAGSVVVDRIRLQMWSASKSTLLFEGFVPVYYQFATLTHDVYGITLSPTTPNVLADGQNVTVNFSYQTDLAGGVHILATPFTGGAPSHNYAAGASPLFPAGTGSGSSTFTITSGGIAVDHIRLEMWDAGETVQLYQAFIPVSYAFLPSATSVTGITGITLSPMNPNILDYGQTVNAAFNYQTSGPSSVAIYVQPMTGGAPTPNAAVSASPVYPAGSGTGSGSFMVTSGLAVVDGIRFQMWNPGGTSPLFETVIPVSYRFGAVKRVHLPLLMQ